MCPILYSRFAQRYDATHMVTTHSSNVCYMRHMFQKCVLSLDYLDYPDNISCLCMYKYLYRDTYIFLCVSVNVRVCIHMS